MVNDKFSYFGAMSVSGIDALTDELTDRQTHNRVQLLMLPFRGCIDAADVDWTGGR